MGKKHVRFKAKVSGMGDKLIIIIPKAYHDNIEVRKWIEKDKNGKWLESLTDEEPE